MLSFHTKRERREAVIRSSLLEHLKDSVQSLIYGPGGENVPRLSSSSPKGQVLGHTDNTNALCCVLEAIFIHELKDTLGERLSSMFSGDLDRMPVPNFWLVIMVISHRDLIEQVSSLSFIMSDVGKSRAWMRLALNQGQLISYLSVLASDFQTLKDYYRPTAFLKDTESCDIMLRILQPLTGISFNLATNAAVLNTWTQTPLILSGTWIPAKYEQSTAPILSATDVASTFLDEERDDMSIAIPHTPLSDQMFDLIIGGTPETKFINDSFEENEKSIMEEVQEALACKSEEATKSNKKGPKSPILNPVVSSAEISQREMMDNIHMEAENVVDEEDIDMSFRQRRLSSTTTYSERDSVMNRSISAISDTNEYRNLLADWESSETGENLPAFLTSNPSFHMAENMFHPISKETPIPEEDRDFEFVSANLPSEKEMSAFLPFLTVLMNEKGLDYQNYHCNTPSCSVPIGMIYGKPRLCKYDGRYYCYDCHQGDTSVIPSRVIHNWDFTPYPVCAANKKWLDTVLMHPLLDIRMVNPKLYRHISELSELQMLRVQLHFIQAYLFTCNIDKGQELRKIFWPREHMYEHVHLYSVLDLKQVFLGKLAPLARQAVTAGRTHIMKCQVCYERGFICEVCKDRQIIFPFQLGDTFTCGSCCGVYHKICVVRQVDCPRCRRLDARRKGASTSRDDCDI